MKLKLKINPKVSWNFRDSLALNITFRNDKNLKLTIDQILEDPSYMLKPGLLEFQNSIII